VETDLRDRIARLLQEIQAMAGPTTWQRVEELVRRIVALQGEGIGRILEHAAGAGAMTPAFTERLCRDGLVSSLLLLHGLHPEPTAERVARAVEATRARLGPEVVLELLEVGADRVVRLRLVAGPGCAGSTASLARAVEHAILEAAPEVASVAVEGLTPAVPHDRLVTLGRPRAGAGAGR
jgi:hypothetical protein